MPDLIKRLRGIQEYRSSSLIEGEDRVYEFSDPDKLQGRVVTAFEAELMIRNAICDSDVFAQTCEYDFLEKLSQNRQ